MVRYSVPAVIVATACSGSDNTVHGLQTFSQLLFKTHGVEQLDLRHVFACESDESRRSYIMTAFAALPTVFCDVGILVEGEAVNAASTNLSLAAVERVALFIAGFSCKDVSSMNPCASSNRNIVSSKSKQTGSTWEGCRSYLVRHQPLMALFENVSNLAAGGNLDAVLGDIRNAGYSGLVYKCSPEKFGIPQTRDRLYILVSLLMTVDALLEATKFADRIASSKHLVLRDCDKSR